MIIPSYNSARYLAEAIQSVLDQSYADFEIIVVNDGSTDETEAVVKGFSDERIRYFAQENKGVGAARNAGLRLARGEYVAFWDADDLFLPEKLSRQVEFLLQDPSVDLVFSGWEYINAEGKILGVEEPWKYRSSVLGVEDVLVGGVAPVHAVLVRRRCLEKMLAGLMRLCERMKILTCGCGLRWVAVEWSCNSVWCVSIACTIKI